MSTSQAPRREIPRTTVVAAVLAGDHHLAAMGMVDHRSFEVLDMALIPCPECTRQVSDQALACPSCGYPIMGTPLPVAAAPSRGIAAFLSFMFPGLGQMYSGRVALGVFFLVMSSVCYGNAVLLGLDATRLAASGAESLTRNIGTTSIFMLLGLAIHLVSVFHAATLKPLKRC